MLSLGSAVRHTLLPLLYRGKRTSCFIYPEGFPERNLGCAVRRQYTTVRWGRNKKQKCLVKSLNLSHPPPSSLFPRLPAVQGALLLLPCGKKLPLRESACLVERLVHGNERQRSAGRCEVEESRPNLENHATASESTRSTLLLCLLCARGQAAVVKVPSYVANEGVINRRFAR